MDNNNEWPKWHFGPNDQSDVFQSAAEVPAGWTDHPSKVITPEKTGSKPLAPTTDKIPAEKRGSAPVTAKNNATAAQTGGAGTDTGDQSNTLDAAGWPWTAELHSATKTQTTAKLWRMKVGVSRPEPKSGFPKPVLDL